MDHHREVDVAGYSLLLREPFFGHLLLGIVRRLESGGVFGLCATGAARVACLRIGAAYWRDVLCTESLRAGALKQEILHLVLKHPTRARSFSARALFDVACDLAVTQHLREPEIAPRVPVLSAFGSLPLEREQSVDYYYYALLPLYDELLAGGGEGIAAEALRRYLEDHEVRSRHAGWGELGSDAASEGALDSLIHQVVRRLNGTRAGWGNVSGRLREYLSATEPLRSPRIPWRRVLRLFAASGERSTLRSTLRRPSKRYGTVPGLRLERRLRLLVALDTSGSLTASELRAFFAEVHRLWKLGATVHVVECDAEVQRAYAYRGEPPVEARGRGGTNFDPALRYANTTWRADAIVYFTDGHGPSPTVAPRARVLWVLTSAGRAPDACDDLPGRKIQIDLDVFERLGTA